MELRQTVTDIKVRSDSGVKGEGLIEGYFSVFDTVDSYNSLFVKGAFLNSIKEKGDKVKFLWNHESGFGRPLNIIGKILEIKEDSYGAYFKARLFLDDSQGERIWKLIKEGIISTVSFGFNIIQDSYNDDGVQIIQEVDLWEVSLVAFEANPLSVITSARGDTNKGLSNLNTRSKLTDTLELLGLNTTNKTLLKYNIVDALKVVLSSIWISDLPLEEKLAAIEREIKSFSDGYILLSEEILTEESQGMSEEELSSLRSDQRMVYIFEEYLKRNRTTLIKLATNSNFRLSELTSILMGHTWLESPERLNDLDLTLADAYFDSLKSINNEVTPAPKVKEIKHSSVTELEELRSMFEGL